MHTKKIKKLILIPTLIGLVGSLTFWQSAFGDPVQTLSVTISAGTVTISPPSNFSFGNAYVASSGQFSLRTEKLLTPSNGLIINDQNEGDNYKVTLSLSNLHDSRTNIISYKKVSLVTLATNNQVGIDKISGDDPHDFTLPLNCNASNVNDLNTCQSSLQTFDGTDQNESNPFDILVSRENEGNYNNRLGQYKLGFGFRMLLSSGDVTRTGTNYTGTLTFTKYQCSDNSCL